MDAPPADAANSVGANHVPSVLPEKSEAALDLVPVAERIVGVGRVSVVHAHGRRTVAPALEFVNRLAAKQENALARGQLGDAVVLGPIGRADNGLEAAMQSPGE